MVYTLEHRIAKGEPRALARANGDKTYIGVDCPKNHGGLRYTKYGQCIECIKDAKSKYRETDKGKATEAKYQETYGKENRQKLKLNLYKISVAEFNEILFKQNSKCAICKNDLDMGKKTCIDHCHNSKKVRGILCWSCNVGLGHFKDSPELLKQAAVYCTE